jgi:poly-gamma-glutamate synthesis protein (capsule biosynthesis protein)
MMHQDVQKSARQAGTFESLWSDVEPLFREADLVFGNLETPVAPEHGGHGRPFIFNAPAELPAALKQSGFQVMALANNHAYDQGPKGVRETLERVEAAGLVGIGAGMDRARAEGAHILERKGIRIGLLACTDLFNCNQNLREDQAWVAALDEERTVQAVREVRPKVDVVILSVHWGVEYQHQPSERQRAMAARLQEAGVDLILGHHPHVLQPLERGTVQGRPVAVAYSMGNFISNQDRMYQASQPVKEGDSRDGMALTATFVLRQGLDGSRRATLDKVGYVPLWTINNWHEQQVGRAAKREIRVIPTDRIGEDRLKALRLERVKAIVGNS